MTSPCLSRDPKSLREYRDELRARIGRIEADGGIDDPLAELVAILKRRLAAVEAELDRGETR